MSSVSFAHVPDNVVVEIFQYIDYKQLLLLARVCKQWKRLIYDRWLWKHVQFLPCPPKKSILNKIIRHYFHSSTQSVELCGRLRKGGMTSIVSNNTLTILAQKSPNLQSFKIEDHNFVDTNLHLLPSSVEQLHFSSCEIPLSSLDNCVDKFKNLKSLSFCRCPSLKSSHLECFGNINKLEKLVLQNTYRIDDVGVTIIVQNFPNLKHLSLLGCAFCGDHSCTQIADNLSLLESLEIEEWTRLTQRGVDGVIDSVKTLKFFSVQCRQLNKGAVFIHGSRTLL